ncbi:Uracil DNA glycosylase superfamily protein [Pseudovibrio axinellae]|uniref:Uracil DNA glycosylase superfamily protein n=1 Tax=Pseudovibrio axinellae TaxID=989403 RepID=A0A165TZ68_9HYPH|nr:uracil-DNA glycosylase family protein [Pseudovibrio axinellae]KZL08503.1 Uracil DNA glycosylase superfamily protein [Pseudovibrio axinellae]SEP76511.1 Uracil-DNA glycosylase [Pseudovibrio axinellae]
MLSATARMAICGQAPGTRVHASGKPFTDPSGVRLRAWLGLDEDAFYDASKLAIIPMGLCFPGLDSKGGDKPPRAECKDTWHQKIFSNMPQIETLLAIGGYAQVYHMPEFTKPRLWETIAQFHSVWEKTCERQAKGLGPRVLPLPHPSWRNNAHIKKHEWFEKELLPLLKEEVTRLIG